MVLQPLKPAMAARIAHKKISFKWEGKDIFEYYDFIEKTFESQMCKISARGALALTLAIGEWICQRFSILDKDPVPMQFLEACWGEQMEPGLGSYFETNDDEWHGSIRGPLSIMIAIANDAMFCLEEDNNPSNRVAWMTNLARHILPKQNAFESWLQTVIDLLIQYHPKKGSKKHSLPKNDFYLGRPVARELFDTTKPYKSTRETNFIAQFLKKINPNNPFLNKKKDIIPSNSVTKNKGELTSFIYGDNAYKHVTKRIPPSYIQQSGILNLSSTFPWKGECMHYGPSQATKLHNALEKIAVAGHATLTALIEEWLLYRLGAVIDIERFLHYVDSLLAWEIDWRYKDESAIKGSIPSTTPINQALRDGVRMAHSVTHDQYWKSPATRTTSAASLVSIFKQTLPAKEKKIFLTWLDWAVEQAAKLDPLPRKKKPTYDQFSNSEDFHKAVWPYFGKALPREALDPQFNYKPEQREELLSKFLASLDWKKNPFLRSPDDMKKLGFKGMPYVL